MKLFLELRLVTLLASGVLLGGGLQFEAKGPGLDVQAYQRPYNIAPEPKAFPVLEPKAYNGPDPKAYQGPEPTGPRGPEPKAYQGLEVKHHLGPEPTAQAVPPM